jgi:hypothetical protein
MNIKESAKSGRPIIKINKSLDKLAEKVLFPAKVKEANQMLRKVGLPKDKISRQG